MCGCENSRAIQRESLHAKSAGSRHTEDDQEPFPWLGDGANSACDLLLACDSDVFELPASLARDSADAGHHSSLMLVRTLVLVLLTSSVDRFRLRRNQ